jgi:hypothetical protein
MSSPSSINTAYDPKTDKARKAKSNDPGWKYGYWSNLGNRDHQVTCTLCDTMVCGGIKRLKQHLAGGYGDTKMCSKTTTAIRKEMRNYLESNKRKRPLFLDDDKEQDDPDVVMVRFRARRWHSPHRIISNCYGGAKFRDCSQTKMCNGSIQGPSIEHQGSNTRLKGE